MEKHSVSPLSYLFARLHLLSSDSFSSTLLSSNLSPLSASALLCFSSVHIVGSLTSKLPSIICIIHNMYISAAVKINCWCLVRKYIDYRFFWGGVSLYSVLFKSTLNNAKMQRNWFHGFRSQSCRGWIEGALVVFAFAAMLGSYLSTFLDSFLSKEIYYNFN